MNLGKLVNIKKMHRLMLFSTLIPVIAFSSTLFAKNITTYMCSGKNSLDRNVSIKVIDNLENRKQALTIATAKTKEGVYSSFGGWNSVLAVGKSKGLINDEVISKSKRIEISIPLSSNCKLSEAVDLFTVSCSNQDYLGTATAILYGTSNALITDKPVAEFPFLLSTELLETSHSDSSIYFKARGEVSFWSDEFSVTLRVPISFDVAIKDKISCKKRVIIDEVSQFDL